MAFGVFCVYFYLVEGEQVGCGLFAAAVGCPMQGRTAFLINCIIIDLALKIDEARDLIILRSHMHNIKLRIIRNGQIRPKFHQVMYKLNMPIERRIEQRRKPFQIPLINPSSNLTFGILLIHTLTRLNPPLHKARTMLHIKLKQLFLIIERKMMQDVIALCVEELAGVQVGVLLEEVLDF